MISIFAKADEVGVFKYSACSKSYKNTCIRIESEHAYGFSGTLEYNLRAPTIMIYKGTSKTPTTLSGISGTLSLINDEIVLRTSYDSGERYYINLNSGNITRI